MINLHLVRIFAAVVETGSYSNAARSLYISQPAVSKSVRELERQLHVSLLDRTRKGIVLTEAGQIVWHHAQQILVAERSTEVALEQLREGERGHLAIGASPTIGIYLLPPILGAFHRRFPSIDLFLDIGTTYEIVERLINKPLDVAFVEGTVTNDAIEVTPWRDDELVLIASPLSEIVAHGMPSLERVLEEPFIMRESEARTRNYIESALAERGISLRVGMEVANTEAIKQMVSAGLGLAIVSIATIQSELDAGRLLQIPIPELTLRRTLTHLQVRGRPRSTAVQTFAEVIQ
jgi:DNA-binding transcriptional LysR family regulator